MVRNILINFPSNIGDVILAFPALDMIKSEYLNAKIVAISSERTRDLVFSHQFIDQVIIYDKHWGIVDKLKFCKRLKSKFDLIIDFKHSALPFILKIPQRTPIIRFKSKKVHLKDKNISLISKLGEFKNIKQGSIVLDRLSLSGQSIVDIPKSIFIATVSNSSLKSYPSNYLKIVVEELSKKYKIVFIGRDLDKIYYDQIGFNENVINLAGKTKLSDVCYLFGKHTAAVLTVDSGILHLASYMNLPIVALFGPTDPKEYGPWSSNYKVLVNKDVDCRPCKDSKCNKDIKCMDIPTQEVIDAILSYAVV